jgi:spore coat polysaccharide biosynthesis protein SpsF
MSESGAIIVARMGSQRLPGKALRASLGWPLVEIVARRLLLAGFTHERVVVATTDQPQDRQLVDWCESFGLESYRGDQDNVAARCFACAEWRGWRAFARVNGDSPFVPGRLIHAALAEVEKRGSSFVTNLAPRSFPYGVSVEVVDTAMYHDSLSAMRPDEAEHVTLHLYRALPERHQNLVCEAGDLSSVRLTIDTAADEVRINALLARAGTSALEADPTALAKLEGESSL